MACHINSESFSLILALVAEFTKYNMPSMGRFHPKLVSSYT